MGDDDVGGEGLDGLHVAPPVLVHVDDDVGGLEAAQAVEPDRLRASHPRNGLDRGPRMDAEGGAAGHERSEPEVEEQLRDARDEGDDARRRRGAGMLAARVVGVLRRHHRRHRSADPLLFACLSRITSLSPAAVADPLAVAGRTPSRRLQERTRRRGRASGGRGVSRIPGRRNAPPSSPFGLGRAGIEVSSSPAGARRTMNKTTRMGIDLGKNTHHVCAMVRTGAGQLESTAARVRAEGCGFEWPHRGAVRVAGPG